jgi:hypothetical protein
MATRTGAIVFISTVNSYRPVNSRLLLRTLLSHRADPTFVELLKNLNVGKTGVREKIAMLFRRQKVHICSEVFLENLFPHAFKVFSAFVNLGDDQQRSAGF